VFVRELLDFKKFDILIITGYKGRSISMEKIIKISHAQLIKQAGSKYNSEMTVVKAKALRMKPTEEHNTQGNQVKKTREEDETPKFIPPKTDFTLPDNTQKIDKIITIIQTHPGEEKITIGNRNISLNEQ
jgi:hypothetical protein